MKSKQLNTFKNVLLVVHVIVDVVVSKILAPFAPPTIL